MVKKKKDSGKLFTYITISIGVAIVALFIGTLILKDKKAYQLLDKEQLEIQMESDERFVLVLSRTWCPVCNRYKSETLDSYQGDLPVYIIEIDKQFFDEENPTISNGRQFEDFDHLTEYLIKVGLEEFVLEMSTQEYQSKYKTNGFSSPTTIIVEKRTMIDYHIGAMSKSELDAFIADNK